MSAYLSTACDATEHRRCTGCSCECHLRPMPADFRARVEAEKERAREMNDQ